MKQKSSTYHIGHLNNRLQLQYKATSTDNTGGTTVTWTNLTEIWADLKPLSGREPEIVEAIRSKNLFEVITRYREDLDDLGYSRKFIDSALRFTYRDEVYYIRNHPSPDNKGFIRLIAERELGD